MPEYIPSWRRQARRRARRLPRPIYGTLTLVALGLLWIPQTVRVPISNQLAMGSKVAWALFGICGLLVLIQAALMAKAERVFSMLFMLGVIMAMGYIATSDPYSLNHLSAFIFVSLALVGWMFWMAHDVDDGYLRLTAIGGVVGIGAAFANLGIGERILMTASLAFINVLYYEHLDGH